MSYVKCTSRYFCIFFYSFACNTLRYKIKCVYSKSVLRKISSIQATGPKFTWICHQLYKSKGL